VSDPRLTPANARVAHDSLRGHIEAPYYVPGEWHSVTSSIADILRNPFGARDRQALFGERVLVLERRNGHAFIQAERDGYVGYMDESALGPDQKATHWVASAGTHLYPEPDFKCREDIALSLGARLTVTGEEDRFAKTANGQFVPRDHIKTTQDWHKDPAAVATLLLGTPYVWGGNSRAGIDCSGLMQAALLACGIPCPGDSDMQMSLGQIKRGSFMPMRTIWPWPMKG